MSHRARRVTDAVRKYDDKLFAKDEYVDGHEIISVFRKCREWRKEPFLHGEEIIVCVDVPYRVMSLTDTWGIKGKPVDWGDLPIRAKLQAMDLWQSGITVEDLKQDYDKADASKSRAQRNDIESFLYEYRSAFAKSTNDVNTGSMDKKNDKRFKGDKRLWL